MVVVETSFEECFRQHENSILKSLEPSEIVLATGGGIVTQEANWPELRRLGTTIYLKSSLENIVDRLERSKKVRPLLQTENWKERVETIFTARKHLYERADLTFDVDGMDQQEAAGKIVETLHGS